MKRLYPLLFISVLIYWGCEEVDTTPPTVTITFPQNNSSVSEMVSITCISSDNEGVDKVELWVNGVTTELTDDSEPYSFDWNTTLVDNGNYTITIRSYDTSDNTTDSEPIVLTVDNTQSNPTPINITSVIFDNGGFTITWNQSTDGDFSLYELEKSTDSTMNSPSVVFTTDSLEQTTYFDTDVNPLSYQYYRITVIDTFSYETKGQIVSSSLDPVPSSVNVESVEYDTTQMTITWSESPDGDFKHYRLLVSEFSNIEYGGFELAIITNQSTTSHSITQFNPNNDYSYFVEVSDTLGQTSIGTGMSNLLNNQPTPVDVVSVIYDLESMTITWEESSDNDFVSYELLYSTTESGNYESLGIFTDINTISFTINDFDLFEPDWYWIRVTDYWNLTTMSNGYMVLDSPPTPSELYPISWDGSFQISWSQNNDDDFQSYKLYESLSEDMSNDTLIYETEDRTDTTYFKTILNYMYYKIVVEDVWGLQSTSNIEFGDYYIELWGEYYSIEYTTELDLSNSGLTGSIPPEIWNLTNLTYLSLYENQLTGSIPPEIGNLTNLNQLYLSNNELTGSIPSQIGNLTNLTILNLQYNGLTGSIPLEIGNLTNLNQLYLYYNQLTGVIPENICDLNINWSSNNFKIFYNQLCPPYPSCIEDYVGNQDTSDCD